MNPSIEMQLLEKLNGFYNGAFSTLVMYTVGLIGLIGIAIPFIIQILQKRSNDEIKKYLEQHINDQVNAKVDNLKEKFREELENIEGFVSQKISEHNNSNIKDFARAQARTLHLQSLFYLEQKKYALSTKDFIRACNCYIEANDDFGISRTIRIICEHCIPNLNKQYMEDKIFTLDADLNDLIQKLNCTFDGKYEDQISLLNVQIRLANDRETIKTD